MIAAILAASGLSRVWIYLAAAASVAAAVILILARAKAAGKHEARIEQAITTLKVKDAQLKAAAAAPRDPDGVARRMRDGTF